MSIVLSNRCTTKAASRVVLGERVFYISDPDHPDHSGEKKKTIHPARNYHLPGDNQTPEAFIAEVIRLDAEYTSYRLGKKGKCSRRLFEELIYSTMAGAWLTEEEREVIERRIISHFASMAVCRTAWHVEEKTGRCDLHILLSAKNMCYPPAMTFWAEFGGSDSDHIYAAMDQLDVEIARYLNRTPERQKAKLKSAKERHQETSSALIGKQVPLPAELALYFRKRKKLSEIDADDIIAAIKSLGHGATKFSDRSITVVFRGRKKPRRYNLVGLIDQTEIALERLIKTRKKGSPEEPEMPPPQ